MLIIDGEVAGRGTATCQVPRQSQIVTNRVGSLHLQRSGRTTTYGLYPGSAGIPPHLIVITVDCLISGQQPEAQTQDVVMHANKAIV